MYNTREGKFTRDERNKKLALQVKGNKLLMKSYVFPPKYF